MRDPKQKVWGQMWPIQLFQDTLSDAVCKMITVKGKVVPVLLFT